MVVVVDNTWLSVANFNPLKFGADIVVESLTKYVSHGTCIGGAIMSNQGRKVFNAMRLWRRRRGLFIGGDHVAKYLAGIKTLDERMGFVGQKADSIAAWLSRHEKVAHVWHCSLDAQNTAGQFYFSNSPGCLTIKVMIKNGNKNKLCQKIAPHFPCVTSYGGRSDRVNPWIDVFDEFVIMRIAMGTEASVQQCKSRLSEMLQTLCE